MNKYVKRENALNMFNRYYELAKQMREASDCDERLEQLVLDIKHAFIELPAEDGYDKTRQAVEEVWNAAVNTLEYVPWSVREVAYKYLVD